MKNVIANAKVYENGEFICTVENKDDVQEYNVIDILEQMVGTEISLQSTEEIA